MKQILCVIDFTESSGKVLEVAARIANACKTHLIVLFPYRLIEYGYRGDMSTLKVKLETEAKEKFQNLRIAIGQSFSWHTKGDHGSKSRPDCHGDSGAFKTGRNDQHA